MQKIRVKKTVRLSDLEIGDTAVLVPVYSFPSIRFSTSVMVNKRRTQSYLRNPPVAGYVENFSRHGKIF